MWASPHWQADALRVLPGELFIDAMMQALGRDYYVSLLTAAAMHGDAGASCECALALGSTASWLAARQVPRGLGAWAPGPLRPSLAEGAVHVWRADLAAVAEDLGELLSSEERARAGRILNERDGELWRRSRGLLRALLGRYLQRDPSSLRFVSGEHGKPALLQDAEELPASRNTADAPTPRLSFNMSHSGHVALYAFSDAGEVGVDVEMARRPVDEVAIAARMLGSAEAKRLQELDPASRQREFLRAWARHEAELKCLGVGIGSAGADRAGHGLWVAQLELGLDAGAAVAAERPARELRCWAWQA